MRSFIRQKWSLVLLAFVAFLGVARAAYNPSAGGTTISANRSTLSGTHTLSSSSPQLQFLDPNGTTRAVSLPSSPSSGLFFTIKNFADATTGKFLVVRDSGSVLVDVIGPGETFTYTYEGTAWQTSRVRSPLLVWLKADAGTWQDNGLSVAASANNDPVGGWVDQSGNGNTVLSASDPVRPLLKTNAINSLPALAFSRTSTKYLSVVTTGKFAPSDITVISLASLPWSSGSSGNHMAICGDGGGISTGVNFLYWGSAVSPFGNKYFNLFTSGYDNGTEGWSGAGADTSGFTDNTYHLLSFRSGARVADAHIDGVKSGYGQAGANGAIRGGSFPDWKLFVGSISGGSYFWDGNIVELIVAPSTLSDSERAYYDVLESDKYALGITP